MTAFRSPLVPIRSRPSRAHRERKQRDQRTTATTTTPQGMSTTTDGRPGNNASQILAEQVPPAPHPMTEDDCLGCRAIALSAGLLGGSYVLRQEYVRRRQQMLLHRGMIPRRTPGAIGMIVFGWGASSSPIRTRSRIVTGQGRRSHRIGNRQGRSMTRTTHAVSLMQSRLAPTRPSHRPLPPRPLTLASICEPTRRSALALRPTASMVFACFAPSSDTFATLPRGVVIAQEEPSLARHPSRRRAQPDPRAVSSDALYEDHASRRPADGARFKRVSKAMVGAPTGFQHKAHLGSDEIQRAAFDVSPRSATWGCRH